MTNFDQSNQTINGDQHNAGRDINIFGSDLFSEKSITAQLIVSLIIQAVAYGSVFLLLLQDKITDFIPNLMVVSLCCGGCFAPVFGIQGLYSLFIGYQSKNKKIMLMSIMSSVPPILLVIVGLLILYIPDLISR